MNIYKLLSLIMLLITFPIQVLAHGEEETEQVGVMDSFLSYGFIMTIALFILMLVLWIFTNNKINRLKGKTKEERQHKGKLIYFKRTFLIVGLISFILVAITGYAILSEKDDHSSEITLTHIHGLGYTPDGKELYIPAHDGLRVYHDGHWAVPKGALHDYMGFSMVDFGFYSSGHPQPGSNMKNPFGVVKSTDMGQTLETLDLYGEIDFHSMAVGYKSHAIYVLNPESNSRMDETGLHYTLDETKTWNSSKMEGLDGEPISLAVHPTEGNVVAIGTNAGLYLSNDYGQTFTKVNQGAPTTAVHFNHEGNLIAGTITNDKNFKVNLYQFNRSTLEKQDINIPEFQQEDAISFIAVNPTNSNEIALATFKRDVFVTENYGQNWDKIVENGMGSSKTSQEEAAPSDSHQGHEGTDGHHDHSSGNNEEAPLDVTWSFDKKPVKDADQTLEIKIRGQDGNTIDNFDIEHEELMHLIIVSKDLSLFQHLHPEYEGNGVFKINTQFPKGGQYKLIADVVPSGFAGSTVTKWIDVEGEINEEELVVDNNLFKIVDGNEISLHFDQLEVGKEQLLVFNLKDTSTDKPITELQPYLGAIGHVVIVSEDGEEYLHSHPMNNDESGPEAKFMTAFPKTGIYKIWGQFKIDDEIVTAPFVVKVP